MFLVTSITMLRERTSGTLERLLTTPPIHKADLLFGYAVAFSIMAALQSLVATAVAYWIFDLDIKGSPGLVVMIAVINAVLGVALGGCCVQRSPAPSSKPCSSCRWWWCPRSCCAACSWPGTI